MIQDEKTLTLDFFMKELYPSLQNIKLWKGYESIGVEAVSELFTFSTLETIKQATEAEILQVFFNQNLTKNEKG